MFSVNCQQQGMSRPRLKLPSQERRRGLRRPGRRLQWSRYQRRKIIGTWLPMYARLWRVCKTCQLGHGMYWGYCILHDNQYPISITMSAVSFPFPFGFLPLHRFHSVPFITHLHKLPIQNSKTESHRDNSARNDSNCELLGGPIHFDLNALNVILPTAEAGAGPNGNHVAKLPVARPRPAAASASASGEAGSTLSVALHSSWWHMYSREANLLRWIRWSSVGSKSWWNRAPVGPVGAVEGEAGVCALVLTPGVRRDPGAGFSFGTERGHSGRIAQVGILHSS